MTLNNKDKYVIKDEEYNPIASLNQSDIILHNVNILDFNSTLTTFVAHEEPLFNNHYRYILNNLHILDKTIKDINITESMITTFQNTLNEKYSKH
jgi:hypothetical protein